MENVSPIRGRDMAAPEKCVTFNGQIWPLKFNNRAARIAEDVYAEQFGRDVGYYAILAEVAVPKHRAIMALVYAGITAAGAEVDWEDFDENFRITDIEGVSRAVQMGVIQSLPDEDPDEDEGEGKNAAATPAE